jgi:acetolactate synthase-1/2/3 large subunit
MRVADLVFNFFVEKGVDTVFSLTGGGAMFLNDAMAKNEKLTCVFNHHEQASAMAGLAYAKATNKFGVVCVTTGCGGTNTITGVLDAWQDSTPVFFISGQCKIADLMYSQKVSLRQVGVQEADIVKIVQPITKYSKLVTKAEDILYILEEAFYEATSGRPGPAWLDIPMDIQSTVVDVSKLKRFTVPKNDYEKFNTDLYKSLLASAKRPLILAGNGIHLSGTKNELNELISKSNIPVVSTFLGIDLVDSGNEAMLGPVGIKGVRSANFALQNADLLICLGTRLSIPVTGYAISDFAPHAKVLVVDVDREEHLKTTSKADHFFHLELSEFFNHALKMDYSHLAIDPEWHSRTKKWKQNWSIFKEPHQEEKDKLNIYSFLKVLSDNAPRNSSFVSDAGSAYYCSSQGLQLHGVQRYVTSGAQADMGFTLPACIGAAFANKVNYIWGVTGDGSFVTNLQEIYTVIGYKLNIKLVVLNNKGYLSIKTTQKKFFPGDYIGTDENNGVFLPEISKLCSSLGIEYFAVTSEASAAAALEGAKAHTKFTIIEVFCPEFQEVIPTLSSKKDENGKLSSRPLHDLYPFLSEEELNKNMFTK